ncbi:hypothetical protein MRX96_032178 [Rhipicephalus microplus]
MSGKMNPSQLFCHSSVGCSSFRNRCRLAAPPRSESCYKTPYRAMRIGQPRVGTVGNRSRRVLPLGGNLHLSSTRFASASLTTFERGHARRQNREGLFPGA